MRAPDALRTAGLTALAMVAFASNSLLCRAALAGGHADATSFTALRVASGAVSLGLLSRARRVSTPNPPRAWGSAVALFGYAIGFSLAYTRIPTGVGALLLFAAVQLTMIVAGLRAGERPGPSEWSGLALSAAGLVVLTRPGLARPDLLGAVLMLGAGIAWGIYSLRGRGTADPVAMNAASFARAVPFALVASAVALARGTAHLERSSAVFALVSGAVTSGLGYAIWYAALRELPATRAAVVQLSVPPLAALGGVLVLRERFSSRLVLSSLLVLGGIAIAVLVRRRHGSSRPNRPAQGPGRA